MIVRRGSFTNDAAIRSQIATIAAAIEAVGDEDTSLIAGLQAGIDQATNLAQNARQMVLARDARLDELENLEDLALVFENGLI